ncbi:hypothetical protein BC832DRAFT_212253 [Gaertneriomyces semiglobifer]|nr:hypothetical protein BC832DRAFT_212253 [Gaertneriomyces semiglobifer]
MAAIRPSFYPLQGIIYFLTHPQLWLRVFCGVLLGILFSLAATITLFGVALKPQAHALDNFLPEWLAWVCAVLLVLVEICVACLLFVAIALPTVSDQLFDDVVSLSTGVNAGEGSCAQGCWMGIAYVGIYLFYIIIARVLVLIVTAPLNLLPFIGTAVFLLINGYLAAWNQHLHWFELRGFGFTAGRRFVRRHRSAYTSFGSTAVLLEMIPGVGILFMFTNIVGAALWAVDMEKNGLQPDLPLQV